MRMKSTQIVPALALVVTPVLSEPFVAQPAPSSDPAVGAGCRRESRTSGLAWIRPADQRERARLDSWCRAVGPPARHDPGGSTSEPVDSLVVVVWNTNVGAAEIGRLVDDLRRGELSGGEPVPHFVLLLQEAHREGAGVPPAPPAEVSWAGRIGGKGEPRMDIVEIARREGLHLLYVPSMRNGSPRDGDAPEDRGNAVLSTLPMADLAAIELPVERQRRVAVAATVAGRNSAGIPWRLRLVSAHLENRAHWARAHRAFGAAQRNQARALVAGLERLPFVPAAVVGGDFNTWLRGGASGALDALRVRYPSPAVHPEGATRELPLFLPGLRLDHLFLRLPSEWGGRYELLGEPYGSDHVPLLGWVRMSA